MSAIEVKRKEKDPFSQPRWMQITQFSMLRSSPAIGKREEERERERGNQKSRKRKSSE
jgi:hypothetical protein